MAVSANENPLPFDALVESVAKGVRDEETLTELAAKLAALDALMNENEQLMIKASSGGKSVDEVVAGIQYAVDPNVQQETAKEIFNTETLTKAQINRAVIELTDDACEPFTALQFRNALVEIESKY